MAAREDAPATAGRTIRTARSYDTRVWLMTLGRARTIRARTVATAGVAPGDAVLDVGCGTGDLTLAARKAAGSAGKVCGIDAAPEMIAEARRKAERGGATIEYQVAVVESLPYADASFDVVLASLVFHHLPHALQRRGLTEIRRVLRPGGCLLIVDFRRPTSLLGRAALVLLRHGRLHHGVQDLTSLLQASGFTHVEHGRVGFAPLGYAKCRAPQPGDLITADATVMHGVGANLPQGHHPRRPGG
jgi:ubiquinone/menaquinone biosynthesis C-methylase UbiE